MVVAKLEHDHTENKPRDKDFDHVALSHWWGWGDAPSEVELENSDKVEFRLYDDDNELYYSGWLLNDERGIVQQFVLKWAENDSGCTILKVKSAETGDKWEQQIG